MVNPLLLKEDLSFIPLLIQDTPTTTEVVHRLFRLSYNIAYSYILTKVRLQKIRPDFFGLTPKDIAIDSIADLFKCNDLGVLSVFVEYLNRHDAVQKDAVGRISLIRKLVFSAVDQNIYRLYRSFDPELNKIIRHLKYSVKQHSHLSICEVAGTNVITIKNYCISEDHRTEIPIDFLHSLLSSIRLDRGTRVFLDVIYLTLLELTEYKKSISLTAIALYIRNSQQELLLMNITQEQDDGLSKAEYDLLINQTLQFIDTYIQRSYIYKEKMDSSFRPVYISTIRDVLCSYIFSENGESCFNYFTQHYPSLKETEYRSNHRTRIEYLVKLSKDYLKNLIKSEI